MWKTGFLLFAICGTLYSCVKAPSYPIIPHIEFVSVSSQTVQIPLSAPYKAIDTFTFSFTDGDGDIGVQPTGTDTSNLCGLQTGDSSILHSKSFNVFLIDSRGNNCVDPYASGNVVNSGKFKAASGNILVIKGVASNKCIIPSPTCADDTAVFSIILVDEAGHLSNTIQSVPIIIKSNSQ